MATVPAAVKTGQEEVNDFFDKPTGVGESFYGSKDNADSVKVNNFFNSQSDVVQEEKRKVGLTEDEKAKNEVESFFAETDSTDAKSRLSVGVKESTSKTPDVAAKQLSIARDFGYSDQYVQDNYNQLLIDQSKSKIDIDSQLKNNPRLSEWISKSINHFPLVKDDINHLNGIENKSNFINGIKTSFSQEEMGFLIDKEMREGLTKSEELRLSQIKERVRSLRPGELTGFDRFSNLSGYGVGQLATSILSAGKGAAYGSAIGALHGAIGGPLAPTTSAVGAGIGAVAGSTASMFDYSYKLESAFMYDEIRDVNGISKDEKVAISRAVGVVNGAIEILSDAAIVSTLGVAKLGIDAFKSYLGKDLIKSNIKKALTNKTTAKILADAAIKINSGSIINGLEEFIQGMVSSAGKVAAGENVSLKEELSDWEQSAIDGYLSTLLTGAAGHSLPLHSELASRRDAKLSYDFFNSLAEGKNSSVVQKLPEKYQEAVNEITKDGPVENVYLDVEKFDEHFQSENLDPREVAKEINKDDGKSYDEAKESGGMIKFRTGDYAVKIAQNEKAGPVLNKYARSAPDAMNIEEENKLVSVLEAKPTEEDIKKIELEKQRTSVEDEITKQIKDTGRFNERDSRIQAKVFSRMYYTIADRTGQSVEEIRKRVPLEIINDTFIGQRKDELFQTEKSQTEKKNELIKNSEKLKKEGLTFYVSENPFFDDSGNEISGPSVGEPGYSFSVYSEDKTGNEIGVARFLINEDGNLVIDDAEGLVYGVEVDASFRRKGIATEIYRTAVEHVGKPLLDVNSKTEMGKKFRDSIRDGNLFFQSDKKVYRGSFSTNNQKNIIRLFKDANLATLLHEGSHFYTQMLKSLSESDIQSVALKNDFETMKKFGGTDEKGNLSAEGNEKIARAFEVYLREGKTPSNDLAEAFRRFRSWLLMIYKSLTDSEYFKGVEINDEIRGVFDRMLATDEEIAEAKSNNEIGLSKEALDSLKLPESKINQYSILVQEVEELAKEKLLSKLIQEQENEKKQEWVQERDKYQKEFEDVLKSEPIHIAAIGIRDGKDIQGNQIPTEMAVKLLKSDVINTYGQDVFDQLPKWSYRVKEGLHPDSVAEIYGIKDGLDLVNGLINYKSPSIEARARANQKMKEMHGDIKTDDKAMKNEALNALLNEKKDELQKLELEMLSTGNHHLFKGGKRISTKYGNNVKFLKEKAIDTISKKEIREADPILYKRAAQKAYKETIKNIIDGDKGKAAESKMREIYNWQLYSQAMIVRSEVDNKIRRIRELKKDKVRAEIGKAGQDYLKVFDSIISQYDLDYISRKGLNKKIQEIDFANFVREKEESGESLFEEVPYPNFMNKTDYKHYTQLTIEEFRGLFDTVSQLRYMAGQINKFAQSQLKQKREVIKAQMIDQIESVFGRKKIKPASIHSMSLLDKAGKVASKFDAALIKPEQQFDMLDDHNVEGIFRSVLFNPAADNENYVNDLEKEINGKFAKLSKKLPKESKKRMYEKVSIPGDNEFKYIRQDLFGIMLNLGNESNMTKIMLGNNLSESQIEFVKSQFSDQEMEYIQGVWDTIESLWPKIEKLHQDVTGLAPPKIKPQEITVNGKKYRGGYYPIMYDRQYSQSGELQLASHPGGGLLEANYNRATTFTGHTKARTNFSARIDLDTDRLLSNISSVIQDLSFRKWVIDANWFLRQDDIKAAFVDGPGIEFYDRLKEWISQVVNDRVATNIQSMSGLHRVMNKLSTNLSVATMGLKATTSLSQIAGLSAGVEVIGQSIGGGKSNRIQATKLVTKSIIQFALSPKKMNAFVTGKSGQMNHRMNNMSIEVRDSVRNARVGANTFDKFKKTKAEVTEFAMKSVALMDAVVSNVVWFAEYNRAIESGMSDDTAIKSADRAVRLSQGSGAAKDLSSIAASKNLKPFVMFYTPFSALYSRMRNAGFKFSRNHNPVDLAGSVLMASVVPAVLSEVLSNRGPDEDKDETYLGFISKAVLSYNVGSIPIFRDIVNASISPYGYTVTPIQKVGESVSKTTKTVFELMTDPDSDKEIDDLIKSSIDTSVYLLGVPAASQLKITGGYLVDLYNGEERPDNMIQFSRDLVFRREKE